MKYSEKFKPFVKDAFSLDIKVFLKKIIIPSTEEQRFYTMAWCEHCSEFSSEPILSETKLDYRILHTL